MNGIVRSLLFVAAIGLLAVVMICASDDSEAEQIEIVFEDGIVVFQQVLHQSLGAARIDDKRSETHLFGKRHVALVVLHLVAAFQNLLLAATILEAMQMHLDTRLDECLHTVKHVDDPAVVGRIWHVEGDDV